MCLDIQFAEDHHRYDSPDSATSGTLIGMGRTNSAWQHTTEKAFHLSLRAPEAQTLRLNRSRTMLQDACTFD